jgi:hypothetical protein
MNEKLLKEYVTLFFEKIRSKVRAKDQKTRQDVKKTYGNKFDIRKFRELDSVYQMQAYANQFLEKLGEGSSRITYLLKSNVVLKIALNDAGVSQNKAEIYTHEKSSKRNVITPIKAADPSGKWIITTVVRQMMGDKTNDRLYNLRLKALNDELSDSEKKELQDLLPLEQMSDEEFKKLAGISFKQFCTALNYLRDAKDEEDVEHKISGLKNSYSDKALTLLKNTIITMLENDLKMGDITSLKHWGKNAAGDLQILDYGFTKDVWEKHYKKKYDTLADPFGPTATKKGNDDKTRKDRPVSGTVKLSGKDLEYSDEDVTTAKRA